MSASYRLKTGKQGVPGCRDNEWLSAALMCAWALVLTLPGDSLAGPAFSENRLLDAAYALERAIGFDGSSVRS